MLSRENLIGPWAGLPVAWTEDDEFDEATYRADVERCCQVGIPGVYTGGTTGEFYAMDMDEFKAIVRATIEECHAHHKPAIVGCTCTYTKGATAKAAFAAESGADGIQVALPFWLEVDDDQVVPFFKEVTDAAGGLALSIYETQRAKKTLSLDQHRAIKEAVPSYLMVKSNADTIGETESGCAALSEFVNVFVSEGLWHQLGPLGANGCCSALVYTNPRIVLDLWQMLRERNWAAMAPVRESLKRYDTFMNERFGTKGFTDTAYDHLQGMLAKFLGCGLRSRGPYISATPKDLRDLQQWCRCHWPEMLQLNSPDV